MLTIKLIEADTRSDSKQIERLLDICDYVYYTGKPYIDSASTVYTTSDLPSDSLYDSLRKKYTPNVFPGQHIVAPSISTEDKIKHEFAMGSLKKYGEDTHSLFCNIFKQQNLFICEKLDGMSCRCTFSLTETSKPKYELTLAVSRYDHEYGRNITKKVSYILGQPLVWQRDTAPPPRIVVTGELLWIGDSYRDLGLKNPRNAVAGLIGRDKITPRMFKDVYFMAHSLVVPDITSDTVSEMKLLSSLGFKTPQWETSASCPSHEKLKSIFDRWNNEATYPIDGLVISPVNYRFTNEDVPEHKVAYKFVMPGAWTTVKEVKPLCERTGIIIPLVEVEPVDIDGTTIRHISGANYTLIKERQITKGSRVYVIRAKGVIPFIEKIDNSILDELPVIDIPKVCPCCKTPLVRKVIEGAARTARLSGAHLVCPNPRCPGKINASIAHYVVIIGVEGMGKGLIGRIRASSIEELYTMSIDDIHNIEGFGLDRATSLYKQLREKINPIEEWQLLASFGIDMIGEKTAKLLMYKFTLDKLFDTPSSEILSVHGLGQAVATAITNFASRGKELLKFLKTYGLTFTERKTQRKEAIYGKTFVLSGTSSGEGSSGDTKRYTREEYEQMIQLAGGRTTSSVSKKTSFLVSDELTQTAKVKKAKELNVTIIRYIVLHKMLELTA